MDLLPPRKPAALGRWAFLAWAAGESITYLAHGLHFSDPAPDSMMFRDDGLLYLALASALALAGSLLARRAPFPALGAMLAAAVLGSVPLGAHEIPMAQFLAVDVLLYAIAAGRERRSAVLALAVAVAVPAGYLTVRWMLHLPVGFSAGLTVAMGAVIVWLVGRSAYQSHEHARQAAAHAAATAAEQAVARERLTIARDVHDTVAHSIGVIALQAGAARRVIETQPRRARDALAEIERAGRETLSSLRRTLGMLRDDEVAPLDPEPGLVAVERLASTTTEAGVQVDLRWQGERRPLPPDIEASAFRIIQEAVTNVVRHAQAPACQVLVAYREEELAIEVLDEGRGRGDGGGNGYGLIGMRERADGLGGRLHAGPRPGGGYRVAACLPLPVAVR
jgi:signal transduction histidine kinase